ncbi:AAA family ATPase [Mycolicibacterium novocastrense]|nr:AAA family ATPase [Mycolicibacterium novocastrense]
MPDDHLKNDVLRRADEDASLSEDARLTVLAALAHEDDLAEVLGDDATSPELVDSLTATEDTTTEPVGAYLRSISVQGFRGIGPNVTLPLPPGPGLVVVAGRNGSGKSTLAESLELALTGTNSRWEDKATVWSQNWRNLHAGEPAEIRIGITEEGSGTTTIGVDWPAGDVKVDDSHRWVQRDGQKRQPTSVLGWDAALETYRPLLSYDELGSILEGRPSDFYDELYKLLGLEQLTAALNRLDAEVKRLKQPAAELKKAKDAIRPTLERHEDPRAATALAQVKKTKPDLDAVRPLITEGASTSVPFPWQQAQQLIVPAAGDIAATCAALRSAAHSEQDKARRSDALAADRARLLEHGLAFHAEHGTQPCPVCGHGTLDDNWAVAARAALEQEQSAAQSLTAARAATRQARTALLAAVRAVSPPPLAEAGLATLPAARAAYDAFAKLPVDDDVAIADHVEKTLPALQQAYTALREEAVALVKSREDAWSPVALRLADWLAKAEAAADAEPKFKIATEAQKWLQANAGELRNERIAPLAKQAKGIWAALRQESNVDLGAIRLEGQKTTRRVALQAAVDGAETEAFGVMSQGELQALALAIFIPRATSPASPFRFVVLDDPIQAMDPSKIDGFLDVLTGLANDRQVIVFTHDDRLPAAIRRSKAPARIVEVTRGANSAVTVTEASRPAKRLLDDAYAIAADEAVPDAVKNAAIPVLCREALEAAAWDVYSSKALAQGRSRPDIEEAWEEAATLRKRLGLALAAGEDTAVDKWLAGGSARRVTMAVIRKGTHGSEVQDYKFVVNQARLAAGDLIGASA